MASIFKEIDGVLCLPLPDDTTSRRRHGCDLCRTDPPTERFVGYCNNSLWFCGKCITKLSTWTDDEIRLAKST